MTFTPRCYIAGPMTGYPDHNYPAFHKAAAEMRALGWEVINPAENHGGNTTLPREDYFRTDIPQLVTCDAVLFLDGWQQSKGARLEFVVARACGVRVIDYEQKPSTALMCDDLAHLTGTVRVERGSGSTDDEGMGELASWPREEREKARQPRGMTDFEYQRAAFIPGVKNRYGPVTTDPFSALLDQIRTLHDKKKQDYTGGEHPLANYANSGESIGVSAVASMFSRMNEKVFRLKQLHKTGAAPQNESVIDSYMDVAILSLLSILALTPGSGYEQEAA